MKLYKKLIFLLAVAVSAFGMSGCIEKTVFPEAHMTVVNVTPSQLRVAVPVGSATVVLPNTVISLNSDFNIPANLESFSISYSTRLGEAIPQLGVPETPLNLKLPGNTITTVTLNPYTHRLYDFFSLTVADISPVNAKIVLTIKDVNNNTTQVEAACQCYANWDEVP